MDAPATGTKTGFAASDEREVHQIALTIPDGAVAFQGRRPKLDIGSDPARADVYVDDFYVGTTPVEIALRQEQHEIVFRKEGYADRAYRVSRATVSFWRRAAWTFSAA